MEGASTLYGIKLAKPLVGILPEIAILLFFFLSRGEKMLNVVDFIDNILNECTCSGVGTHAGEGIFSESDEAFLLVSVETEMKLLVVGIEDEITAFFLHAFESQSVFKREMLDGNRAFADIKPLLAEDVIHKYVARGIIYVGCEGNVGDYLTVTAGRSIFPRSISPIPEETIQI